MRPSRTFTSLPALLALAASLRAGFDTSYAPIVAYNPNLGGIYGAAAFLKDGPTYYGLQGMFTAAQVYAGILEWKRPLGGGWRLSTKHDLSNFYDLYYGEGNATRLDDQVRIDHFRYLGDLRLSREIGAGAHLHVVGDWRSREDHSLGRLPSESTARLGLGASVDQRDDEFSPRSGYFLEALSALHPSVDGTRSFGQASLDGRIYHGLGKVVLAGRLYGGTSSGEPSYLYRYQLGGSDELRGYYGNRFRGKHKYSLQGETRFPLYKAFSGVVYGDMGEVSDKEFDNPQFTYGLGLRIGLPPSGMMKARIDYGRSADQSGLYVAFGHAF